MILLLRREISKNFLIKLKLLFYKINPYKYFKIYRSWSFSEREVQNTKEFKPPFNLKKINSKAKLTTKNKINHDNKSFSSEQYSKFLKLKEDGLIRNLTEQTINNNNTPVKIASPFLKLKEKLSDQFMNFLKKHRYSAIMMGNTLFQGQTGNFYINMKKNQNDFHYENHENSIHSNVLKSFENSQKDVNKSNRSNDKNENQNEKYPSLNQSLNESGSKNDIKLLKININQIDFNFLLKI